MKVNLSNYLLITLFGVLFFFFGYSTSKVKVQENSTNLRIDKALQYCHQNNMNTNFCILIDMNVHSGRNRLVVWDFKNKKSLKNALVSHGCGDNTWGSDDTKTTPKFSNTPESHLSSLGKYAIGDRGWSNWGINVKYWLKGLDASNSNAISRVIVLHGWVEMSDKETYPNGSAEGWGCPAVSENTMRYLDTLLCKVESPVLLWIYK